jgi:WD40 repeat protein/serine/threonine protein kinase
MNERRCVECGASVPADAPGGLCPSCLLQLALEDREEATESSSPPIESEGLSTPTCGPYRALRLIGEGGMGLVYLAEQLAPVRRSVALKIVKPGRSSRQVLARFESERQALALLQHPSIAAIYDAGTTPDGHPFFAMEYVPGQHITRYCDEHRLPIADRLELFLQVCAAVQHAHQKGIIHRDLKPSNLLVTRQDERPLVKVIDFGVAKAVDQRLTDLTLDTQHGMVVGTPAYMSPEQAGATSFDVDTRTDIYSLGVVLYELLAGLRPFEAQELREAAIAEMLRLIREEDPPRLSTRISSAGDAAAAEIARHRRVDVRALARQLRGDLEWITLRSLEKDPSRRYASASELAGDVRRHLNDEPVSAGPPRLSYRARKFVSKHKAAVGTMIAIVAALSIGLVTSLSMYVRANQAMALAQHQGYVATIAATDLALQAQAAREAQRRLLQVDPSLRGWEWQYLSLVADSSVARFETNAKLDSTKGIRSVNFDATGQRIIWDTGVAVHLAELTSKPAVASWKTGLNVLGRSLDGHRAVVSRVLVQSAGGLPGERAALGRKPGYAELRDVRSGAIIASLGPHEHSPIVFSPDGRRVVVGARWIEATNAPTLLTGLRILDAFSGREVQRIDFPDVLRGRAGQPAERAKGRMLQLLQWGKWYNSFATFSFSPDGQRLAYCQDSSLYQWDASTGRALTTNRVDGIKELLSATYVERGRKILCQGRDDRDLDGTEAGDPRLVRTRILRGPYDVQVEWDASTGKLLAMTRRRFLGRPLAVSPDGGRLATARNDRIMIVDTATDTVSVELRGHTEEVRTAAFSPDGRLLVSGADDAVRVWSTESDRAVMLLHSDVRMVTSLVFHPNGQQIIAGNIANGIEIWDLESRQKTTLSGHRSPVVSVALSRDGSTLVSGGQDGTIHRWRLGETHAAQTMGDANSRLLQALAFDPQRLHVVAATADKAVRVWNSSTGRLVTRLREADGHVEAVDVSPDGGRLVAGTESGVLMLWNTATWELAKRIKAHSGMVRSARFSPDGRTIASSGHHGPIQVWDAQSGANLGSLVGHEAEVSAIAFSPDGRRLVSGSSDGTVRIWDAIHLDPLLTLRHGRAVNDVAWSADGTRIAAAATGGTVLVWNARRPEN